MHTHFLSKPVISGKLPAPTENIYDMLMTQIKK